MYDTTDFWIDASAAGGIDMERLSGLISGHTVHQKQDGHTYISGMLKNAYRTTISEQGISLKGSLATFHLNSNINTLTRASTVTALEELSDCLRMPIYGAKVTRLDFAQNFLMKYKPEAYYPYLGESRYFKRLVQPKSIYWSNGNRTKVMYNKMAEASTKRLPLPAVWQGKHVLRFEVRYTRRLSKSLQQAEITASTLKDEKFYMAMVNRWHDEYQSIQKLPDITLNYETMNSPKDFWKQMALLKISEIGQQKTIDLVEDMRARGAFDKPEYYSRLKKEIKLACTSQEHTTPSELIEELDKKINAVKRYCR